MQPATAPTPAAPANTNPPAVANPTPADPAPGSGNQLAPNAAPEGFISLADHNAALGRVRQEEKNKLYPELQAAQEKVKQLTEQNSSLSTEVQNLKTSVESLKAATDANKKLDVQKLVEEVTLRASKTVAENAQLQITTLQTQVAELQTKLAQASLKEVRDRLIDEAGGPDAIIPELVKGNTEAELRESIAYSKKVFEAALARRGITASAPAGNTPANTPAANGNTAPAAPASSNEVPPVTPAPLDTGSGTLRPVNPNGSTRIPPGEWKSMRDQRLREAQGRYPTR